MLPASVPVRGPDGELIDGAVAGVTRDDRGIAIVITMPEGPLAGHIPSGRAP